MLKIEDIDLQNLDEKSAKSLHNQVSTDINKYNKAYYQDNESLVPDSYYDALMKLVGGIEAKYPDLVYDASPTQIVGYKVLDAFEKVKHEKPMLSLANAFSKEDVEEFVKKMQNFLKTDSFLPICAEPKIDGVSFAAIYEGGKLIRAASRGGWLCW